MTGLVIPTEAFSPGDLVFFAPTNLVGDIVSFFTLPWRFHHRFAHIGIVVESPNGPLLVESTRDEPLGPCVWANEIVHGVQAHPLAERLAIHCNERGGQAWRFALREPLTRGERSKLQWIVESLRGKHYDFLGAFRARDLLFGATIRWIRRVFRRPSQNGSLYYCNELGAEFLRRLGRLPFDFQPDSCNPKSFARVLLAEKVTHEPIPVSH